MSPELRSPRSGQQYRRRPTWTRCSPLPGIFLLLSLFFSLLPAPHLVQAAHGVLPEGSYAARQSIDPPQPFSGKLPSFRLEHLSIDDGLSNDNITAILQDHEGYLWFGTGEGLNRYDGYHFTVYRHDPDNPDSLLDSTVTALYEDSRGNLWVGTRRGLDRFVRSTAAFVHYRPNTNDPNSLSGAAVSAILEDEQGYLWVGTRDGGLNRLDPSTKQFQRFLHDPGDPASVGDNTIQALYLDEEGILWVGTAGAGLNSYNPQTREFTRYPFRAGEPGSLGFSSVTAITADRSGRLWVGTSGGGLARLDSTGGSFTVFRSSDDFTSLPDNRVQALLTDALGRLWVGTQNGMAIWNQDHVDWYFQRDIADPNALRSSWINTLYEDRSGTVWIGTTGGGASKYNRNADRFARFEYRPGFQSLSASSVTSIVEDNYWVLWVGTMGGGLNRIDRTTGTFTYYQHLDWEPNSISSNDISAVLVDEQGIVWIGTRDTGLNSLDPQLERFQHYRHSPGVPGSLSSDRVTALLLDRQGFLWVGTENGGLNRMDRRTGAVTTFLHDPAQPNSLSHNSVNAIFEDREGRLWVGTQAGINRYDPEKGFIRYIHPSTDLDETEEGWPSKERINAFYQDAQGMLWIGTDGGLSRLDPSDGSFAEFTEKNGLPNNVVRGILGDDAGDLWLSTNRGLARFNPTTLTFRSYDVRDGLQSGQFNTGACFRSRSGEMFFGGVGGFNAFFPEQVKSTENQAPPPVVITAFRKGNETVRTHLANNERIELSYQDYLVSFEFAALDYSAPEKNRFAYRLAGVDKDWVQAGTRNYASYTNLRGGDYVFQVRAANSDGVWNNEGVSVQVHVTPPFWETLWFRVTAGVLILGTAFAGVRLRLLNIERRNRELEEQVAQRTVALRREIIQRELAEKARQASESRYRELVESANSIIMQMDRQGRITFFNPFAQSFFGYTEEEILGKHVVGTIVPEVGSNGEDLRLKIEELLKYPERFYSSENENQRANGERVWVAWTNKALYDAQGELAEILCIGIDRTAQKRAEEALAREMEERAAITERTRLARELHDSVSQALYGITLGAHTARTLLDKDPKQAAAPLDYVYSLAQAGMSEMKALIFELRPESLELEGLVAALTKQAAALQARHELAVNTSLCAEPDIPLATKEALYRIAQEAMHNIVKHARATQVDLRLECEQGKVILEVRDNGVGFDPEAEYPGHLGLISMRERAQRINAVISIESAPGEGACVRVEV